MLSPLHRLRDTQDIQKTLTRGRSDRDPLFRLCYRLNQQKAPRFAFVVSNKVSKKAVVRNRLRRQMRSVISLYLDKITKNADTVIIAYTKAQTQGYAEIRSSLERLLEKNAFFIKKG